MGGVALHHEGDPAAVIVGGKGTAFRPLPGGRGGGDALPALGPGVLDHGRNLGHDHIGGHASLEGGYLHFARRGEGKGDCVGDDALFGMDDGILGVGGEAGGRKVFPQFHVALHALAALLLVGAEDDPDSPLQLQPGVEDRLRGEEADYDRPLVVQDTPAPDHAVFKLTAPGVHRPALSFRNHVQVSEEGHHFVPFAHFGPARHVVHVFRPEPHLLREGEGPVEAFPRSLPVGSPFRGFASHALDAHGLLDGGHKFIFHCIDFFRQHEITSLMGGSFPACFFQQFPSGDLDRIPCHGEGGSIS